MPEASTHFDRDLQGNEPSAHKAALFSDADVRALNGSMTPAACTRNLLFRMVCYGRLWRRAARFNCCMTTFGSVDAIGRLEATISVPRMSLMGRERKFGAASSSPPRSGRRATDLGQRFRQPE